MKKRHAQSTQDLACLYDLHVTTSASSQLIKQVLRTPRSWTGVTFSRPDPTQLQLGLTSMHYLLIIFASVTD